ncbi:MAG: EamA family transporter RarD [Anaerolineae bacterium]|nr:EamA family transporter RarD [Anaerolineae bacterium]
MNKGMIYAAAAYVMWGLLPLYWKALDDVPADQILANRIVWSLVFVSLILTARHNWDWLSGTLHRPRVLATFALSGVVLGINWFIYIWAVNAGFIVETSLGYFINPLVNVLFGYLFLKERLRPAQWFALAIALSGVLYLTFSYGAFPWIALTLAFTFGIYGFLRKTAPLNSAEGLFLETAVLFLPAIGFLLLQQMRGVGAFGQINMATNLLLIGAGLVTSVPLLLFAAGARRITLTSLGLLQYIAPTLQFLIGVLIFNEPFGISRLIGFGLIWLALIFYTVESLRYRRRAMAATAATS